MTEPQFDGAAFDAAFDRPPRPVPAVLSAVPATDIGPYVAKVVAGVAGAPEGQRNHILNQSAYTLGRLVAGGQLTEATATANLTAAAQAAGLQAIETAATIQSGLNAGAREPRVLQQGYALDDLTVLDALTVITAAQAEPPSRRLVLTVASSVRPERQRWLWTDRIPLDALCLLAGREGLGKSTIATDLAAQVTRGDVEGELHGQPRDVLIVATEDNRATTIVPRLVAANADMDRVHFVNAEVDGCTGQPVFPTDTTLLAGAIEETKAALVILDAATSLIDGKLDGDRDRQMRRALEPLGRIAGQHACSILGIVHFGKRADADTGKLILGSIAWSQVARAVVAVARDEDSGHLLIQPTKHNLAPGDTPAIAARLVPADVATDDGMTSVGRVDWLGETDAQASDHLGRRGDDPDERTERDEAVEWLGDYLDRNGGQVGAGEAIKAAASDGIAKTTLTRARQRAGVESHRVSTDDKGAGHWVWTLATQESSKGHKNPAHVHADSCEISGLLGQGTPETGPESDDPLERATRLVIDQLGATVLHHTEERTDR